MKQILPFLFFLFSIQPLFATHIVGGSISYEYLGNNEYNITLEVLRDCYNGNPAAFFDDPAKLGIFDSNNILVDSFSIPFNVLSNDTISFNPSNVCVFPPSICVHKAVYEQTIILPNNTESFTIAYQRCCRSFILTNLVDPLDTGMTFHTSIDPANNNTAPQFNSDFPFAVFAGTPFIYDASAFDPDGDSLVYELVAPFIGATPEIPQPTTPSPPPYDPVAYLLPIYSVSNMLGGNYPLTIDSLNGEMSAIPSTLGVFQIAYAVKEYRNGSLISTTYREFAFVVINPPTNQTYDLEGQVFVNGNTPLDLGVVQVLERDITTNLLSIYDEQAIGNQGTYSFNDIPPGVFYTKAIVDSTSMYFDNHLPTYFDNAAFWYDADEMDQCDTSQNYRDIHLIHTDSLIGDIILNGYLVLPDNNDTPVENIDLFLVTENGIPIITRTTDANGYFSFENLDPANYFLYADIINSEIDNSEPPLIELEENSTINVYFHDEVLSLSDILDNVNNFSTSPNTINAFPNPTNNNFVLQMDIKQSEYLSLDIFDIHGKRLDNIFENKNFLIGAYTETISIENFPKGIYCLRVKSKDHVIVLNIIKQ